jgi:hypothetical protein
MNVVRNLNLKINQISRIKAKMIRTKHGIKLACKGDGNDGYIEILWHEYSLLEKLEKKLKKIQRNF